MRKLNAIFHLLFSKEYLLVCKYKHDFIDVSFIDPVDKLDYCFRIEAELTERMEALYTDENLQGELNIISALDIINNVN